MSTFPPGPKHFSCHANLFLTPPKRRTLAVGFWDFSTDHASGNYTRSSHRSLSCQEQNEDLVVRDANIADLRGLLGPAVLRGPKCRVGTDWQSGSGGMLGLRNFIMSNGLYEALQFDGALNDVSATSPDRPPQSQASCVR